MRMSVSGRGSAPSGNLEAAFVSALPILFNVDSETSIVGFINRYSKSFYTIHVGIIQFDMQIYNFKQVLKNKIKSFSSAGF